MPPSMKLSQAEPLQLSPSPVAKQWERLPEGRVRALCLSKERSLSSEHTARKSPHPRLRAPCMGLFVKIGFTHFFSFFSAEQVHRAMDRGMRSEGNLHDVTKTSATALYTAVLRTQP